jgi:hypothetical protein
MIGHKAAHNITIFRQQYIVKSYLNIERLKRKALSTLDWHINATIRLVVYDLGSWQLIT